MTESPVIFPQLPPVDRRTFVPDDVWVVEDGEWVRVSRHDDLTKWELLVTSEDSITTELKKNTWPRSSSSSPLVMASMIAALKVTPGMRVLEIGTGTGWNAACLDALGAEVISVEIDPAIADRARANLRRAGQGIRT
ncbi:protein-L-isoaspartate O-methyltransferase family protein [Actinomadura meridiana]